MYFVKIKSVKVICLLGLLNLVGLPVLYAQELGGELIPSGNFGTVETNGFNGDATGGVSIYPTTTPSQVGVYYQPAKKVWNWSFSKASYLEMNPGVTIGHPVSNKTSYKWGFAQLWNSTTYTFPHVSNESNTWTVIPNAPAEGYYVITTSTAGMYSLPALSDKAWTGPVYDKYETNFENPTNYFMVVDGDMDPRKIYYREEVNVKPGSLYRMSVDVISLNNTGVAPSIAFVVSSSPNNLSSIEPQLSRDLKTVAVWENLYFDYVVPSNVTKLYVAFRNNIAAGTGNDLAIDNLSMREVLAGIYADQTATNPCRIGMTLKLRNADFFANRTLGWQKKNPNGVWVNITGASGSSYIAKNEGIYRAVIYIDTKGNFYSTNEIQVKKDGSCLALLPLTANDDVYQALPGVEITKNVLDNDELTSLGDEAVSMSVVKYTVNSVDYSAGSSAPIYEGQKLLGMITLESDGTMIFKSVTDITPPKQIPSVTYHVQASYGTVESAQISIAIVGRMSSQINVTYDASCVQCPIYVKLSGGGVVVGQAYKLYRENVLVGTFDRRTLELTFNETISGTLTYTILNNSSEIVKVFEMEVHPASAEWRADPTNTVWQQTANWNTQTGSGYPIWCTDVTIPGTTTTFPLLVDGDAARDITFKDGASVGQIQKLTYRKAFVETNPSRNRWYMLSAPLRYMYSADLHGDVSWENAVSPKIYMMYFDVLNNINPDGKAGFSVGNFTRPFAKLEESLSVGKSYTLWINGKENGMDYDDNHFPTGTPYKFPRLVNGLEPQYSYHNSKTGEWTTPVEKLNRGKEASIATDEQWIVSKGALTTDQKDNRYRFLFEESISGTSLSIPVEGGKLNAIGNPFMSHIDFERFVTDNEDKIQGFYRIWDGTKFYLYITDISANTLWSGLGGLTTETTDDVITQYIAPLQSFFVEVKEGVSSLDFKTENILGANTMSRLRSSSTLNNLLKLELRMNGSSSRAFLAVREGASNSYDASEDINKLFAPGEFTPEIYTIADKESIELNMIGAEASSQEVPLGIRTTQEGDFEIIVEGAVDFDAYDCVLLKDNVSGQMYDLKTTSNMKFSKTNKNNIETRFSLLFTEARSSLDELGFSGDVVITDRYKELEIESTGGLLRTVELIDVSGQLKISAGEINSQSYSLSKQNYESGVYVVRVTSDRGVKTAKVVF